MATDHLLVLDEGTTSARAILFDERGACLGSAQEAIVQHYPGDGWVEHDPAQIWEASLATARNVLAETDGAKRVAGIGITNQRETILFWSRKTGQPLGPAIVWRDRRTAPDCQRLAAAGHEEEVARVTGLLLDPYFSASKIGWALRHWPHLREAGADLAIGTVESWLVWKLTGGLHVTDATNASRTALMDLETGRWSERLCDLFGVPVAALPEIVDCALCLGSTDPDLLGRALPICGMAGDQQSAAIGQACLRPGETKATYGTGAFVLAHAGERRPSSAHRLLATVAWQIEGRRSYALEGSVFVAGSLIKWLRDDLGLIGDSAETAAMAASVPDSGGVHVVPAHSGLGAPYWRPEARGAIFGLSLATGRAQLVRASLESMSFQTHDLMRAFAGDGVEWRCLRIDGGMAANDWLAQDLADLLGIEVERPDFVETTALGAAMLAGVGSGLFASLEEAKTMRGATRLFAPRGDSVRRSERLAGWRRAIDGVLAG